MSFIVGCHLSSSKGFVAMFNQMEALEATSFQYFSRNPRGSAKKPFNKEDVEAFNKLVVESGKGPFISHAPYTLNPCSKTEKVRDFAKLVFKEDMGELKLLENVLYNFHPGSHVGQGIEQGIETIAKTLNEVLEEGLEGKILLEGMAGKGTEIGSRFEELALIIEKVHKKEMMGVCLDTCHLYDAGYDIVENLDGVLEEFDRIVGLEKLKAMHLNDSKNPRGSHKDRHEKLGEGFIGLETFKRIVNHPRLKHVSFALETPNDMDGYAKEIEILKSFRIND